MDELKLRLEYLEHVSQGSSAENSLLDQVDAIGMTLDTMLDVRKQEVQRMATEFNKRSEEGKTSENHGQANTAEKVANPSSEELQRTVIASRIKDLSQLATELETQLPLDVPEIKPPPNPQDLIAKASELGKEYDELTIRSTELTKKLMDQLSKENTELGRIEEPTTEEHAN